MFYVFFKNIVSKKDFPEGLQVQGSEFSTFIFHL